MRLVRERVAERVPEGHQVHINAVPGTAASHRQRRPCRIRPARNRAQRVLLQRFQLHGCSTSVRLRAACHQRAACSAATNR